MVTLATASSVTRIPKHKEQIEYSLIPQVLVNSHCLETLQNYSTGQRTSQGISAAPHIKKFSRETNYYSRNHFPGD